MVAVREGDTAKLAVLFERHHRALYRFLVGMTRNRETAEDLVQDVFFRMLRHRVSFDGKHGFLPWMYRIARNACTDYLRTRRGVIVGIDELMERGSEPASPGPDPERSASQAQDSNLLRNALLQLPEDKRELLMLSRFQGLKYEEVAQVVGCEVATVKVRIYRAVRALERVYLTLAGEKAS